MTVVCVLSALVATGLAGLRWLRVAQREHYLPGAATRFAGRWWSTGASRLLAIAPAVGFLLSFGSPLAGGIGVLGVTAGPYGLSVRGRTSKLAWTRRLRTLAAVWAALQIVVVAAGALAGRAAPAAVLGALAVPLLVDAALLITKPIEDRLAQPFVHTASIRLRQVAPVVVGITGSYGKTSTKNHVAHLLSGSKAVVPTPRSFNNRAGLARAINEQLALGTDVFVAEMGTYGPGEIAEMVAWCPPAISVITAIGPVHLERMKTEEAIARAKEEILAPAATAVLNVDVPLLRPVADRARAAGKRVVGVSGLDPAADVAVIDGSVLVGGRPIAAVNAAAASATNVACAVAVALELGVTDAEIADRLATLPPTENRRVVGQSADRGFTTIDDTFNANPAGARAAIELLATTAATTGGRQVIVTPGMVELGARQADENRALGEAAGRQCDHVIVVGHTNRRALVDGVRAAGRAELHLVETRPEAVDWVRAHLHEGDVVLYENDLPDNYP